MCWFKIRTTIGHPDFNAYAGWENSSYNSSGLIEWSILFWDCSGSVHVVERLSRNLEVAGSSITGATALCPSARQINPCLVLIQPRKACPYISEKLLTGTLIINLNKSILNNERGSYVYMLNFINCDLYAAYWWPMIGNKLYSILFYT